MAEEVKIRVTQEAGGPPVLAQTKKDLEGLKAETAAINKASGGSGDGHGGHGVRGFSMAGVQQEATTLVRELATGMPSGRTIGALLGQMGIGKLLLNPFVIGLTTAIGAAAEYVSQEDKEIALRQSMAEQGAAGTRARDRSERFSSSPAEAAAKEMELREKIGAASAHRQDLINKAQSGLFGRLDKALGTEFFTKGNSVFKPESAREIQALDAQNGLDQAELAKWEKTRQANFAKSTAWENAAVRDRLKLNMAGARHDEDMAAWWKDYTAQLALNPKDEAGAQEIAGDKMALRQRERAGAFGHLINARSGAADVAQAARLAHWQMTGSADLGHKVDKLGNHLAPLGHMSREQFQPRLKLGGS